MSFGGLILTNSGRNLLAKAQTGKELKFTRVGLGDGSLGGTSIVGLKALKHEVQSLDITGLEVVESNVEITTFLTNKSMDEGFYLREIGVFALDPDVGEILYCYDNAGVDADYIPPEGEVIIERNMRFTLIISNVSNVIATIDSSLIFATKKDLENIDISGPIRIHNEDINSHPDIRESVKELGLQINQLPDKYALKVHGHKWNEISEKPSTFPPSSHTQDWGTITGKPTTFAPSTHTHTPSQVGLGNVQNYGIATTAEAQAGTSNVKYMTPALVNAAVKYLAETGGISMVKKSQRGVHAGSAADITIPISSISPDKSFVVLDNAHYGADYGREKPILLSLTSTSLKVSPSTTGSSTAAGRFSWQVIEFY